MQSPAFLAPLSRLPLVSRTVSAALPASRRPTISRPGPARPARTAPAMHGPPSGHPAPAAEGSERRPGSHKGFVEEMRFVAMRLHTKDQAPREGEMEESSLPISEWRPKQADYLQFLVDSLTVYDFFESAIAASSNPAYAAFRDSGLERTASLHTDIAWFTSRDFIVPEPTPAATRYVTYLEGIVEKNPPAFVCQWYNYYFAHSAGGRMIGRMMSNMLFDGHEFEFYKWEKDVKEILGEVRVKIDAVAAEWDRETKDKCLEETSLSFAYSGTVLANLAKAAEPEAAATA